MSSKKRDSIDILFNTLYKEHPEQKVLLFSNTTLKTITQDTKFMNQFDAVKFDSSEKLPDTLKEKGYFIVHLGKGNHAFVKGNGYHKFESISDVRKIDTKGGLIDEVGQSEAGAISFIYNSGIIQNFLGEKNVQVHTARRSKVSFGFKVNGAVLFADKQQIELDGIFETPGGVIIPVEAKNVEYGDFEIRQIFSMKKYFDALIQKGSLPNTVKVRLLFLVRLRDRKQNLCKIYEYKFTDDEDLNSIKFVQAVEYVIK